jgi:dTDP-4-amino-4,6-dideoxygalactose transaminase
VKKYYHEVEGYNGRLDAIQAGILQIKLRHLSEWNLNRRKNADRYNELIGNVEGIITPFDPIWSKAVYHLYVIRTKKRDELQRHLSHNHIDTGIHYPIPLHLQKAYTNLGYKKGDFPQSEKAASEILSLPMFPTLTEAHVEQVTIVIKEFISKEESARIRVEV